MKWSLLRFEGLSPVGFARCFPVSVCLAAALLAGTPLPAAGADTTLDAVENWRLGGDDEEGAFFGVVGDVAVDTQGNAYFLDAQLSEVQVYDAEGMYLRTIGHEGEGPGEFRRPVNLFLTPEGNVGVIQRMPGTVVLLTPEGDPAGQIDLATTEDGGRRFFQDGGQAGGNIMLLSMSPRREGGGMTIGTTLAAYDAEGNTVGSYVVKEQVMDFANPVIHEKNMARPVWAADSEGNVFVVTTYGKYEIGSYAPDGTPGPVMTRDYESLPRTQEEMLEAKGRIRVRGRGQGPTVEVEDYHPDIQSMHSRDDGTLWVLTSRGGERRDGVIGVFDRLDAEGNYLGQVTVTGEGDARGDGLFFRGDRLFVVRHMRSGMKSMMGGGPGAPAPVEDDDEEAEPIEIICYTVPAAG